MVKRHRAIWANAEHTAITYSTAHRQIRETLKVALSMQKVISAEEQKAIDSQKLSGFNYDAVKRNMTMQEIANIPVVKASELLAPRGRMRPRPRGMSVAAVNQQPLKGTPGAVGAPVG